MSGNNESTTYIHPVLRKKLMRHFCQMYMLLDAMYHDGRKDISEPLRRLLCDCRSVIHDEPTSDDQDIIDAAFLDIMEDVEL